MGRILQVFTEPDGLVRDVEVKRGSGTYMRPITKIRIIYPAEGFADYNGDSPLWGGGGLGGNQSLTDVKFDMIAKDNHNL